MDLPTVVAATAQHIFGLYRIIFSAVESPEEALASAGAAVFVYLTDCGMPLDEGAKMRDLLIMGVPPL